MHLDDGIAIGRVLRPWGRRGAVVVEPLTHDVERFERVREVWVAEGESGLQRSPARFAVKATRFDGRGRPILTLSGCDTIDAAERLRGLQLLVPAQLAERPAGDAYFDHELVGAAVETVVGKSLGQVTSIVATAGASLLVIAGPDGEILVPAARSIVRAVDVAARRIVVDPPAGLLELNAAEVSDAG